MPDTIYLLADIPWPMGGRTRPPAGGGRSLGAGGAVGVVYRAPCFVTPSRSAAPPSLGATRVPSREDVDVGASHTVSQSPL